MDLKEFFKKDLFAVGIGVVLDEISEGYARSTLKIEERHLNAGGVAQGGAIFTLADFTMAVAANSRGLLTLSVQSDIKYISSAILNDILTAETEEVSIHKKISNYRVIIRNQDQELIAILNGMCYSKSNIIL